ncbi:MAG: nucleotidyltransferase domain-containing protein [Muribaculaceae bacterium]|nr:nucleotidyltransferase domain-containing protein [Muribaculaceae bacterium]
MDVENSDNGCFAGKQSCFAGIDVNIWSRLISVITENSNVEEIILYGSRAKGTHRDFSDIDLSLIGDKLIHINLFPIIESIDLLNLPYEIDLSLYKEIDNQALRDEIDKYGIPLLKTLTGKRPNS